MKKLMFAAALVLTAAVFAEDAAAPAAAPAPAVSALAERPRRLNRPKGPAHRPLTRILTEKTTLDDLAAFKKEICDKIDSRFAEYTAGTNKAPVRMMFMVSEPRPPRPPRLPGAGRAPHGRPAASEAAPKAEATKTAAPKAE